MTVSASELMIFPVSPESTYALARSPIDDQYSTRVKFSRRPKPANTSSLSFSLLNGTLLGILCRTVWVFRVCGSDIESLPIAAPVLRHHFRGIHTAICLSTQGASHPFPFRH